MAALRNKTAREVLPASKKTARKVEWFLALIGWLYFLWFLIGSERRAFYPDTTQLLRTSNFIGPWYHAALLFSG